MCEQKIKHIENHFSARNITKKFDCHRQSWSAKHNTFLYYFDINAEQPKSITSKSDISSSVIINKTYKIPSAPIFHYFNENAEKPT